MLASLSVTKISILKYQVKNLGLAREFVSYVLRFQQSTADIFQLEYGLRLLRTFNLFFFFTKNSFKKLNN